VSASPPDTGTARLGGRAELAEMDLADVDFLDLGCSRGGSIAYCTKRFHAGQGLGIDASPEKVREAQEAGTSAVLADATALGIQKSVRFVSMMQFLEHLPDPNAVEAAIGSAATAATDFLFIHHPSFEGEAYLESLGLRQYWWHWRGHPSHVMVEDYCNMFERLDLRQYMIRYIEPVEHSSHPTILPVSSPIDQFDYDAREHPPKPSVRLRRPVWRFQEIFVALRPLRTKEWNRITAPRPARAGARRGE
jgi:SAM-dependent methyltransferase